jgi:hypothetical protein
MSYSCCDMGVSTLASRLKGLFVVRSGSKQLVNSSLRDPFHLHIREAEIFNFTPVAPPIVPLFTSPLINNRLLNLGSHCTTSNNSAPTSTAYKLCPPSQTQPKLAPHRARFRLAFLARRHVCAANVMLTGTLQYSSVTSAASQPVSLRKNHMGNFGLRSEAPHFYASRSLHIG